MTQERFLKLLDNPDLLSTISYEELKTTALSYPYAHNLRYLLALKARQDEHPDADRALVTASVYSLDRKQLFLLTAPKQLAPQPLNITVEELVLELKPIESVQRELQALAPQPRVEEAAPPEAKEGVVSVPLPEATPEIVLPLETVEKKAVPETPEGHKLTLNQPFVAWISKFNPPVLEQVEPVTTIPVVPTEEEDVATAGLSAHELAERSVAENKDVISETLARLLAKQGYRDKAIRMYERLCLAFPEKDAYFAAEIEKLKK
ncbi:MAG: hypothetical protein IPJ82_05095 [Lewinellaceae bacterium]|nr:hypothetical protein [Lewinellaceae bacterium]